MDIKRDIKCALHDLGFNKPRKHQVAPIKALTNRQDTIVIAGTSSGKTAIYQTAGLVLQGLTVVIEPLLALIYNQVKELQHKGISADYIDSTRTKTYAVEKAEKIIDRYDKDWRRRIRKKLWKRSRKGLRKYNWRKHQRNGNKNKQIESAESEEFKSLDKLLGPRDMINNTIVPIRSAEVRIKREDLNEIEKCYWPLFHQGMLKAEDGKDEKPQKEKSKQQAKRDYEAFLEEFFRLIPNQKVNIKAKQ